MVTISAETSIVIKTEDRSSATFKTISKKAEELEAKLKELQDRQHSLSKQKANVSLDTKRAREELKKATDRFNETRDSADGLRMELAQASYDGFARELKTISQAARDTEKQIHSCEDAISKIENTADDGIFSIFKGAGIKNGLAKSGLLNMLGDSVSGMAGTLVESAIGQPISEFGSSVLSGIVSGAAAGAFLGAPGAIAGAAIGGFSGLVSGSAKVYEAYDDAYKGWYAGLYETSSAITDNSLASGSTIAGGREQAQVAFAQRFGNDEAAKTYLERVKRMAASTNYSYDEITGYSKLLLNSYDPSKTLGVLQTLSDATAGLNLNSSDINMFISGLSRMRTTGKATQEYLNYFSERGVDVYSAIAEGRTISGNITAKNEVAGLVTNGDIKGNDAAQWILDYIDRTYGSLSDTLASTYDARMDNLRDIQSDIDAAMGEGYNAERGKSIAAQIESYGADLGDALQQANKAIGKGRAALDNLADQYTEEALSTVLIGKETTLNWSSGNENRLKELAGLYQEAMADYDAGNVEAGALIETYLEEARALAEAQYDSSDAIRVKTDAENDLITAIRENTTALNGWKTSYDTSQNFTKGLAAGGIAQVLTPEQAAQNEKHMQNLRDLGLYAVGIDYVPYDNFPALLHQGERVQTAVEARSERSAPTVTITGNQFTIREEADIHRVASELLTQMELAGQRG